MPTIHDLRDILNSNQVYDETQTDDTIKSGDFIICNEGILYMDGPYPVMIKLQHGVMGSGIFHRFVDYFTQREKFAEFEALKKERGWHPNVTPREIALAIITLAVVGSNAESMHDLHDADLWAKFDNWKGPRRISPMFEDIERSLNRLGFERLDSAQ